MKAILLVFLNFQLLICGFTWDCKNTSIEFCEIIGYNRNHLPPYPPLEVNVGLGNAYNQIVSTYNLHSCIRFISPAIFLIC